MEDKLFTNGLNFFLISSISTIVLSIIINFIAKVMINRFNKKYSDKITTNQYLYHTIRAITWLVCLTVIIKQIAPEYRNLTILDTRTLGNSFSHIKEFCRVIYLEEEVLLV